jgi:hypothetical protein
MLKTEHFTNIIFGGGTGAGLSHGRWRKRDNAPLQ